MRAVAYCRVSTENQAQSGAGIHAQADAVRAHAARLGAELAGPFADEGIGGATPMDLRPGLVEALAQVGTGDVLLVAKRDRLGRDPIVVAMIEATVIRQGGRVVSAAGEGTDDDSPSSILMRRVIDAVAENERLIGKVRTRAALQAKRDRGERTGTVPLGFDLVDDGRRSKQGRPVALVTNPAEQATIDLVRRLRTEGTSLRGIAAELDRRGIRPKQGADRWAHSVVVRILSRPAVTTEATPPTPITAT